MLSRFRIVLFFSFISAIFPQSPEDFNQKLFPILEKAQCRMCHNDNGVASRTRLQFPADNATPDQTTAFGLRLSALVDRDHPEESLLYRKPTNRIQHTGGERIHPGGEEEKALREWTGYLASLPEDRLAAAMKPLGQAAAQPAVVRRLTHSQYNQTVAALLGDQTRPADQFPGEDYINGFTNQAAGQSIAPVQEEAYNRAAEKLARNAFRAGDLHHLIPCKASSATDTGCRQRFIREFGRKAFRRPLTESEAARYERLFLVDAAAAHDFLKGAQLVLEAMLQSPNFLFHLEEGPGGQFPQYRTASRLSYFLWDTMPDETLFAAAAAGELGTPEQIERAARRMLDDPRAQQSMDVFLAQWLRLDRLKNAIRDRRFYPEFSTELVSAMMEETRQLFHHVVWENGNFLELFTARYAYLNNDLAQLYGLPAPKQEFARVDFPADFQRAGLVGEATFLALTSKPAETSPTERGLFVREHFLCQIVPPPPAGVNTTLPPPTDEKPLTNRERLQVHLSNKTCAACHGLIDPIGFGLEHYDGIGRFRAQQVVTIFPTFDEMKHRIKMKPTEHRLTLDTTAFVRGIPQSDFGTPRELGRILANEIACQKCVVKQLFRYAVGRPETSADQPVIEASLKAFQDSRFRFQSLIMAIITSKPFLGGGT
jgi:hypothetical protein